MVTRRTKLRYDKPMNKLLNITAILLLSGAGLFVVARPAEAACTSVPIAGSYTVGTSCQFPFAAVDGVDTASGNNTAVLTISTTRALTVGDGQTIVAGSIDLSAASVSINFVGSGKVNTGSEYHIYTTGDADGDGHVNSTTFSTSGTFRRAAITAYTYEDSLSTQSNLDCGPDSAAAKPGQGTYQSGSFTNSLTGLSYDWNCDGVETKAFTVVYTCGACTNGSGYASTQATLTGTANQDPVNTGFLTSTPGCNTAGTRYTVSSLACQDPLAADCSLTATSNGSVTQTCL